jgi:hypothetical protein
MTRTHRAYLVTSVLIVGIIVIACGGSSSATDVRLKTLEARVAAQDASATAAVLVTATAQSLITQYAASVATQQAQPTATPIPPTETPVPVAVPSRPLVPVNQIPNLVLSGSYTDVRIQTAQYFAGLAATTDHLMANPTASADWSTELRANMQGYVALAAAWRGVSPPTCATAFHAGMSAAYETYADGASKVIDALDSRQSVFTAVTIDPDRAPLLKQTRAAGLTFDLAMKDGWHATDQAIQLGTATKFVAAIGFDGLDLADLYAVGILYRTTAGDLAGPC